MLKDSIVSDHIVPSLETRGKTYYNLRNKLEADGVISERKFVRNYEFSAPSAASAVISDIPQTEIWTGKQQAE